MRNWQLWNNANGFLRVYNTGKLFTKAVKDFKNLKLYRILHYEDVSLVFIIETIHSLNFSEWFVHHNTISYNFCYVRKNKIKVGNLNNHVDNNNQ